LGKRGKPKAVLGQDAFGGGEKEIISRKLAG